MANIKGKSLGIFSAKGGVGKTTTTLNLAGILSTFNKKVLIIDFDIYSGSIASFLNKNINKTIYNFADDYANNRFENISNYVTKYNDNISFLPTCTDPRQGSKIDVSYTQIIIEKAIYEYDYVLIDMNHSLDEFNITILDNVDLILTLFTNDLTDLKNMRNLLKIFKDADINNYKVILNESIMPFKKYYSLYDMKCIINNNIDYKITSDFNIKSIDKYIMDGKILTLEDKFIKCYPKLYKTFNLIIKDLEDTNEE